jgi:hypothetical protein
MKSKINKIWKRKPLVIDTDAKANDSNQHYELREIADATLLRLILPAAIRAFPEIPRQLIVSSLELLA